VKDYAVALRGRYGGVSRKGKGEMLDEFVRVTGDSTGRRGSGCRGKGRRGLGSDGGGRAGTEQRWQER